MRRKGSDSLLFVSFCRKMEKKVGHANGSTDCSSRIPESVFFLLPSLNFMDDDHDSWNQSFPFFDHYELKEWKMKMIIIHLLIVLDSLKKFLRLIIFKRCITLDP